jgi:YHS domain-containing protein
MKMDHYTMVCNNFSETREKRIKEMVRDLVCCAEIEETKSGATYDYEGQTYYFCAPECKDQFVDLVSPRMNQFGGSREDAPTFGDD